MCNNLFYLTSLRHNVVTLQAKFFTPAQINGKSNKCWMFYYCSVSKYTDKILWSGKKKKKKTTPDRLILHNQAVKLTHIKQNDEACSVPSHYHSGIKHELSSSRSLTEFKECFSFYDKKRNGKIDTKDLITAMRCLGTSPTYGEIERHLQVNKISKYNLICWLDKLLFTQILKQKKNLTSTFVFINVA